MLEHSYTYILCERERRMHLSKHLSVQAWSVADVCEWIKGKMCYIILVVSDQFVYVLVRR